MSSEKLLLGRPDVPEYLVRTIVEDDIDQLRVWKNAHRDGFFFKNTITPPMQEAWFRAYLMRTDDFMLIIVAGGEAVGSIGFRRLDDRVDLYNLMIGAQRDAGRGHMAKALDLVCQEVTRRYPATPIMVSVLRCNTALQWYFRRGFVVTREHEAYVELTRSG
jgi:RimJ/RimL family protein N-acetyltransferase